MLFRLPFREKHPKGRAPGVLEPSCIGCESQWLHFQAFCELLDITLVAWNWHSGIIYTVEIGKCYKSRNISFLLMDPAKHLPAHHRHPDKARPMNALLWGYLQFIAWEVTLAPVWLDHSLSEASFTIPLGPLLSWLPSHHPPHEIFCFPLRLSKCWPLPASSWNTLR